MFESWIYLVCKKQPQRLSSLVERGLVSASKNIWIKEKFFKNGSELIFFNYRV
jgi:hypothetical protein